jgi:hypothetical protein
MTQVRIRIPRAIRISPVEGGNWANLANGLSVCKLEMTITKQEMPKYKYLERLYFGS